MSRIPRKNRFEFAVFGKNPCSAKHQSWLFFLRQWRKSTGCDASNPFILVEYAGIGPVGVAENPAKRACYLSWYDYAFCAW